MKISTKGRYGTRFMVRLALAGPDSTCTLKDIAQDEAMSEKYLWQIAKSLKDAGLIHAAAGAHGGYRLVRAPAAVTLGEMLAALEGDLSLVECTVSPSRCRRSSECVVRAVWTEVSLKFREILDGIRLSDLVDRYHESVRERQTDYVI